MSQSSNSPEPRLSLSAAAARNLATATVTVPQMTDITPRWLHKLLPWVDVDGGVYRVNRIAKAGKDKPANPFGEAKVELLTADGGEPKLPTPDDFDELLSLVWKKPAFFLAHPKALAAFGREATRRGVPPPTVTLFGSPFITWRGVPVIPSDKLPIDEHGITSILLLRVGESQQGVVGLQKTGVTGEVEPGLSVRYMGTNESSIASHLVTRYFSAAVLTEDAIARLDNVSVRHYHEYV